MRLSNLLERIDLSAAWLADKLVHSDVRLVLSDPSSRHHPLLDVLLEGSPVEGLAVLETAESSATVGEATLSGFRSRLAAMLENEGDIPVVIRHRGHDHGHLDVNVEEDFDVEPSSWVVIVQAYAARGR